MKSTIETGNVSQQPECLRETGEKSETCRTCYNYILYGCKGNVQKEEDCKSHWTDEGAEQEARDLEAREASRVDAAMLRDFQEKGQPVLRGGPDVEIIDIDEETFTCSNCGEVAPRDAYKEHPGVLAKMDKYKLCEMCLSISVSVDEEEWKELNAAYQGVQ